MGFHGETRRDECVLCTADGLKRRGERGVAYYARGHPVTRSEGWDEAEGFWSETESVEAQRLVVVMVGDDEGHEVDVDDMTPVPREAFCGECGQMGCGHDGIDREPLVVVR